MRGKYPEEEKRLVKIAAECIRQLQSIGIYPPAGIDFLVEDEEDVNHNAHVREELGDEWIAFASGSSSIHVKPCALQEEVPDSACMHIVMHEILHTCAPGADHGGKWLQLVKRVNRELHYDISRYASAEVSAIIRESEQHYKQRKQRRERAARSEETRAAREARREQATRNREARMARRERVTQGWDPAWNQLLRSAGIVINGDIHISGNVTITCNG